MVLVSLRQLWLCPISMPSVYSRTFKDCSKNWKHYNALTHLTRDTGELGGGGGAAFIKLICIVAPFLSESFDSWNHCYRSNNDLITRGLVLVQISLDPKTKQKTSINQPQPVSIKYPTIFPKQKENVDLVQDKDWNFLSVFFGGTDSNGAGGLRLTM